MRFTFMEKSHLNPIPYRLQVFPYQTVKERPASAAI